MLSLVSSAVKRKSLVAPVVVLRRTGRSVKASSLVRRESGRPMGSPVLMLGRAGRSVETSSLLQGRAGRPVGSPVLMLGLSLIHI